MECGVGATPAVCVWGSAAPPLGALGSFSVKVGLAVLPGSRASVGSHRVNTDEASRAGLGICP